MSKQHTPTAPIIHWSDDVRLKMIDKSNFYPGDERVYQYGYFDGFHEAIKSHEAKINNHDRLVEALRNIVITINTHTYPLGQNGVKVIEEGKQLLNGLKQQ